MVYQIVSGVAPVIPMYIDTIIPAGIVGIGVTVIGQLWARAKEEGRAAERDRAAQADMDRLTTEHAELRDEVQAVMQATQKSTQEFRESLARISGVLVGIDGQNGLRSDMKEARAEIRDLREKTGGLAMGVQSAGQRLNRLEEA